MSVFIGLAILLWVTHGFFTWVNIQNECGWWNLSFWMDIGGLFAAVLIGPLSFLAWTDVHRKNRKLGR
jgi:hypothetical protein